MSEERGSSGGALIVAFLAGALAGVAVALLASPKVRQMARRALDEVVALSEARDV